MFRKLLEVAPVGSFEDLRDKVRTAVESKVGKEPFVVKLSSDGSPLQRYPWVVAMYPDKVVMEWMDTYYEMSYAVTKSKDIALGKPVKVEQIYKKVKETSTVEKTLSDELRESSIQIEEAAKELSDFDTGFTVLREASFDEATGVIEGVLIEAGTSLTKRRHYPDSTLREVGESFGGLKMYLNHPTAREEAERPERDLRDWVSTITESWYDNGKVMGRIAVHDPWLRSRLSDNVFREHIGLSINASGKLSFGQIAGQNGKFQIVEKITLSRKNGPASVDWVTEAGARGRVSRLIKETIQKGKKSMEISEASFEDVQRENPKLVESITSHVAKKIKESESEKEKDVKLKEAERIISENEQRTKKEKQQKLVEGLLEKSDAPQAVKERVVERLSETIFETEDALKESFGKVLKAELEYVNKFSAKGTVRTGASTSAQGTTLMESLQSELDERTGVQKKEEKSTK